MHSDAQGLAAAMLTLADGKRSENKKEAAKQQVQSSDGGHLNHSGVGLASGTPIRVAGVQRAMDSIAILRMGIELHIGVVARALLKSLYRIHVLLPYPKMLSAAQI